MGRMIRTALSWLASRSSLALVAGFSLTLGCATKTSPPPPANAGATYVATGNNVHYDSGCSQAPSGKIVKGQRFTLVEAKGDCWLIEFEDQTETYIIPTAVAAAE